MDELSTSDAPESIGPYSQGIRDGDRIFVSGQGPLDPDTGEVVSGDIGEQTERTLENVAAILEAGGASLDSVVKATVFVTDMDDYDAIDWNAVIQSHLEAEIAALESRNVGHAVAVSERLSNTVPEAAVAEQNTGETIRKWRDERYGSDC